MLTVSPTIFLNSGSSSSDSSRALPAADSTIVVSASVLWETWAIAAPVAAASFCAALMRMGMRDSFLMTR